MSRWIDAWAVLSDYTASDHLYIGFVIRGSEEKNVHRARKYIRWCHKKIDEDIFKETLEWSCIRTPSQELTAEESGHEIRVLSQMHATQPCLVLGAYIEILCIGGMTTSQSYAGFVWVRERSGKDSKVDDAPFWKRYGKQSLNIEQHDPI